MSGFGSQLRSTADIVGSLLTRPGQKAKIGQKGPVSVTAVERRLQEQRQKPVEMLKGVINEREAAALEVPSSDHLDFGSHDVEGGPDAPGGMSEAEFNRRLQKMMKDAPGGVSITSGKRDPAKQKQLWENALKKYGDPEIADNWVARPGTSKHESGLAADLKFASPAVKKWYHENAKKYGLYFPMSHEPWHIQFDTAYKGAQPQTRPRGHSHAHSASRSSGGVVQKAPGRFYTGNPHVDFIIDGESNGITTAKNPHSSAFGIGQMIKANREAYGRRFGFDPNTTDPGQQIQMMLAYIKDRYGTPEAAAAFKRKHGWY